MQREERSRARPKKNKFVRCVCLLVARQLHWSIGSESNFQMKKIIRFPCRCLCSAVIRICYEVRTKRMKREKRRQTNNNNKLSLLFAFSSSNSERCAMYAKIVKLKIVCFVLCSCCGPCVLVVALVSSCFDAVCWWWSNCNWEKLQIEKLSEEEEEGNCCKTNLWSGAK